MSKIDATDEVRGQQILHVLNEEFGELLARDPSAFQSKYRKMAGSPFAFYRGTACLFYHDLAKELKDNRYLNDQSNRVWIHGDLHAENFGTYMDAQGHFIFNVNDFDEAYVGPFIWDLKRFVASVALIGHGKALGDEQIKGVVQTFAAEYHASILSIAAGVEDEVQRLTLDTAKGPLLAALQSARSNTRAGLLDSLTEVRDNDRRFSDGKKTIRLDENTRNKVLEAFNNYLKTLPEPRPGHASSRRAKDIIGRKSVGIGSAGLPSYNIVLEGATEALENDVLLYMKQAQKPAVSRHIDNITAQSFFKHEGHRTVISQRALQSQTDHWSGWTELDGVGQMVGEISPYSVDLDWTDIDDPEEIIAVVQDLGRATAIMHAGADKDGKYSEVVPFSAESAIKEAIANDKDGFIDLLVSFAHDYAAQVRRDHQIFVDLFRNGKIPGLPAGSRD